MLVSKLALAILNLPAPCELSYCIHVQKTPQHLLKAVDCTGPGITIGGGEAAGLYSGKPRLELDTLFSQIQQPLTPVGAAWFLDDKPVAHQAGQDP